MVGVDGDHRGHAFRHEGARHGLRHLLRRGDRQARMPTQHFDMGDGSQRLGGLGDPARRKGERIAAGQDDLPDFRMPAQIVERGGKFGRAQRSRPGPDPLAAEAETAIDRAYRDQLDEDPVRDSDAQGP